MNTSAGRRLENPERYVIVKRNFLIVQIEVPPGIPVEIQSDALDNPADILWILAKTDDQLGYCGFGFGKICPTFLRR